VFDFTPIGEEKKTRTVFRFDTKEALITYMAEEVAPLFP
jgi:hypothetical protein